MRPIVCDFPQHECHDGHAIGSFATHVPAVGFRLRPKHRLNPGRSILKQKVNLKCDELTLPFCFLAWSASSLCRCAVVTSKTTIPRAQTCRPEPPLLR